MTERLPFHFSLSCIGEGNGNPLQCSCLENPRDGGASWAAVYRVTQSRTWLKWLSSSSSKCSNFQSFHILTCFGTLEETCSRCNVAPKLMKLSRNTNESADRNNMQQTEVGFCWLFLLRSVNHHSKNGIFKADKCVSFWVESVSGQPYSVNGLWNPLLRGLVKRC